MIRVGDLQRSIDFFAKVLGMQPSTSDNEEYKILVGFLFGYGDESSGAVIELTPITGV